MANSNEFKNVRRENQIRRNDNINDLNVNLYDVDSVIKYYFDNVIQPTVMEGDEKLNVPIIYGSPERWKSIQKSGMYRDRKGKAQFPVIVYKRTSVEKNKQLGSKVDTKNPLVASFQARNTLFNRYDNFQLLTNRKPTKQFHNIVIPDYVKLSYSCIIFTEYLEQLNKVVEDINYAEGQYWGQDKSFKFLSKIDSFDIEAVAEQGQDRISKATFTLTMNGFIIPDNIQKAMSNYSPKTFSQVKITTPIETVKTEAEVMRILNRQESILKPKEYNSIDKELERANMLEGNTTTPSEQPNLEQTYDASNIDEKDAGLQQ